LWSEIWKKGGKVEIRVLSRDEFLFWLDNLAHSIVVGMLLGGDRLSYCDEVVGVIEGGNILGVATIAPKGEENSGQPTIVALYLLPEYRRQGHGMPLLEATIKRCIEHGFKKIRIDAMSTGLSKTIAKIAPELRKKLKVRDFHGVMDNMLAVEENS
jgi:GNAT superfamily N-acetyltransferase